MPELQLTPDQVLATTRAVRHRLDLTRPVEREVLEECLRLAQQAPRASNVETRAFVLLTEPEKKAELAEIWRRGMDRYLRRFASAVTDEPQSSRERIMSGVKYLGEHLEQVPVHLIPCVRGRLDGKSAYQQSGSWGTIVPATWSFMLAARARGLGTCWTTFHLAEEERAAQVLGIPYGEYTQIALIPVAYTVGTQFKHAPREALSAVAHWNGW